MTRAIYLIGPPGVGKTTTTQHLTNRYTTHPPIRLHKQLWAEPLHLAGHHIGYHLGKTRPTFGGTDALGMAANPDATTWALNTQLPPLIIGEGQRLATPTFLHALHQRTHLTIAYLTATNTPQRRQQRTRNLKTPPQNEAWINAATTRARNLAAKLMTDGLNIHHIDTTNLTPQQVAQHIQHASQEATRV